MQHHNRIYDAHCHLTDNPASLGLIPTLETAGLVIMATNLRDQRLVADTARKYGGDKVVPSFGWHPWFSWEIYDDLDASPEHMEEVSSSYSSLFTPLSGDLSLGHVPRLSETKLDHYNCILSPTPDPLNSSDMDLLQALPAPIPLSFILSSIRAHLIEFPTALVGEVGLDKPFRLLIPSSSSSSLRSRFTVSIPHQRAILSSQLKLAFEMGRAVSVHGVHAQGTLWEAIRDAVLQSQTDRKIKVRGTEPPKERVCLHSYSGHAEFIRTYLSISTSAAIYFSFSPAVNLSSCPRLLKICTVAEAKEPSPSIQLEELPKRLVEVIKNVADDRILVESDLAAADERVDVALRVMVQVVCVIKGWDLVNGTNKLAENWRTFVGVDSTERSG